MTEVSRSGGGFFQREIQAQVYMTVDVAKSLISWLQDKVDTAEAINQAISERREIESTDAASTLLIAESEE